MSTVIKVENVVKRYGDKTIIPNMSLQIESGEFFTLLGPSGCGKTTLLRMIAGFNSIEGGAIYFNDDRINDIQPYKRNIGMVFQNYAIFPHMTVRKNIEYGLKQRQLTKEVIRQRTDEIMEIVKITEHADKSPAQLSGGQQQRVALARAIVIQPAVLLMDEPLSNLDAKLRVEMRGAIRDIQKRINITTVYVTHDQEEALAVSDRIAIMNLGEIQQIGTPVSLYKRPANEFVASFIGISNIFDAQVKKEGGTYQVVFPDGYACPVAHMLPDVAEGTKVKVSVRPEEFGFVEAGGLRGQIKTRVFLGHYVTYEVRLESGQVVEVSQDSSAFIRLREAGDDVVLRPNEHGINVFSSDGAHSLVKEG